MVGHFPRSEGCLSLHSNPQKLSEIPTIHLPRYNLTIPVSPCWPFHGPTCLHQNYKGGCSSPPMSTCPSLHLPRWLADSWPIPSDHQGSFFKNSQTHSKTWIHHQHREIFRDPYSDTYISRCMPEYHHGQSLSVTRSMISPGGMYSSVPFCNIASSSSMAAASGFYGQFGGLSSMVQDAHASSPTPTPTPSSSSLPPSVKPYHQTSSSFSIHSNTSTLVADTQEPPHGHNISTSVSISDLNHRRLWDRLGSSPQRHISLRNMVSIGKSPSHTPPGTLGCFQSW